MVFEGVLATVINRFLGAYVKNLDASQLNVGIWSGDVLLERLEVKENALAQFDVPLRVFKGYLGKLRLKVPWSNLYTAPVLVEIDGVYIIAGPSSAVQYDADKEAKEETDEKQRKLREIDEARKKALQPDTSKQQDPGFVEKLITQIIRNVQVTVKNIHIRYEDFVTRPGHPFSFGITLDSLLLDSLLLHSTDSGWRQGNQDDSTSTLLYKVARLQCLGVYWNSNDKMIGTDLPEQWMGLLEQGIARSSDSVPQGMHYILRPVSALAKLQLSTRPGQDMNIPQLLAQLVVQEVAVEFEKQQYYDVMALVESMDRMIIKRKYRKYRPFVSVRGNVKAWWLFAYNVVSVDVKRRLNMWSWRHIKKHRMLCREYTHLYTEKLLSGAKPPPYLIAKTQDLEEKLDLFNITVCRQLAETKAYKERKLKEEESAQGGWVSWAAGWLGAGGGTEESTVKKPKIPTKEEIEDERKKLYDAIGYSEKGKAASYKKEYIAHKAEVTLHKVSFKLKNSTDNIGHIIVQSLSTTITNRPSSNNIGVKASLSSLSMTGSQKGQTAPNIITSQQSEDQHLLSVSFDLNPLGSKFDQSIKARLSPIQISYNADTVDDIISFFLLPKDIHMSKVSSIAANTLEELKTQSRAGLQHVISKRQLLDLDVELCSPVVVIPEGGVRRESGRVIVLNCGSLCVTSSMKHHVPDVQEASLKQLEQAFYDQFILKLTSMSIALTDEAWLSSSQDGYSSVYLLNPLELNLMVEKSLLPNDTRLPSLKVTGDLPKLSLSVSDRKIKQLIVLLQSIPLPPPSLANRSTVDTTDPYTDLPVPVVTMGTSAIVDTVSSTMILPPPSTESEDEDEDTSECEEEEEGEEKKERRVVKKGEESVRCRSSVASSTQLALKFIVSKVCVEWSTEKDGEEKPRLKVEVAALQASLKLRTWDMRVEASLGSLSVLDYYHNTESPSMMLTGSSSADSLLHVVFAMADRTAPDYQAAQPPTHQSIIVHVAMVMLQLHSGSLSDLLAMSRDIITVVSSSESSQALDTHKPTQPHHQTDKDLASSTPVSLEISGERLLNVAVKCGGVGVCLCDDDGDVVRADVTGLSATVQLFSDKTWISASVRNVSVINLDPEAVHTKMLTPVDSSKSMLTSDIRVYKRVSSSDEDNRTERDLSVVDVSIDATVQRVRGVVLVQVVRRLVNFAKQLKDGLDEEMMASAREAANKTAVRTAEVLKESSSTRVKLSVVVDAPEIILPLSTTSQCAVVADLGKVEVKNQLCWAEQVYSGIECKEGDLSNVVVDVMSVGVSTVQLYRVTSIPSDGSVMSCDHHMILMPLQCQATVQRSLSSQCAAIPAVDVAADLHDVQLIFRPDDYRALMSILDSLKEVSGEEMEHVAEEVPEESKEAAEITAIEDQITSSSRICVRATVSSVQVELRLGSEENNKDKEETTLTSVVVSGLSSSVDIVGGTITVGASLKTISVANPNNTLYPTIVSFIGSGDAVNAKVVVHSGDIDQTDMDSHNLYVELILGRLRLTALMMFVNKMMLFFKQMRISEQALANARQSAEKSASAAVSKIQELHVNGQRIKLHVTIDAPEILLPSSSTSPSIMVAYLGLLKLSNTFHMMDTSGKDRPVYEAYTVTLSDLRVYRSTYTLTQEVNEITRTLLHPFSFALTMRRNLSASWYTSIPTIDLLAKLDTIQMSIGTEDIEGIASVLNGNLKEALPTSDNTSVQSDIVKQSSHEDVAKEDTEKESQEVAGEEESDYVQVKIAAELKSVTIQLYGSDGHSAEKPLSLERDASSAVSLLSITHLAVSGQVHSTSAVEGEVKLVGCDITDSRPGKEGKKLIESPQSTDASSLLSITYNGDKSDHSVIIELCNPQVLLDVHFLLALNELATSYAKPFSSTEQNNDNTVEDLVVEDIDEVSREVVSSDAGKDIKVRMKVRQPRIALLEDSEGGASGVLVLQTDVDVSYSKTSSQQKVFAAVNMLNIVSTTYKGLTSTATKQPVSGQKVLEPCDITSTLTLTSGDDGGTQVTADVGDMIFTISPATVRLVLGVLKPLQQDQTDSELVGETAPSDLWFPTDTSNLWYLHQLNATTDAIMRANSRTPLATTSTPIKNENLSLNVRTLQVLVEREEGPSQSVTPAISLILGSHDTTAVSLNAAEWSGKFTASASLTITASYFNDHNDIWEPLIEPLVRGEDRVTYKPWKFDVEIERPLLDQSALDDPSAYPPELILQASSVMTLQLTLTKASIALITRLAKDYQKTPETIDTGSIEDRRTTVKVVNKLGDKFPVTVQPLQYVQLPSQQREVTVANGDEAILHRMKEEEEEIFRKQLIGELLPQREARERMIRLRITVSGFAPTDLSFRSSGKRYYPLKQQSSDGEQYAMVVYTDKQSATDPTIITLTAPVQLHNHFSSPIEVLWSTEKQIHRYTDSSSHKSVLRLPQNEISFLPLDKSCNGYIFFRPAMGNASNSTRGVNLKNLSVTRDVNCDPLYVHVRPEKQNYLNKLLFSLESLPHHVLHLSHPLLFHNLLPYKVIITAPCNETLLPGQQVYISKYDPSDSLDIEVKVYQGDTLFNGEVHVANKMEESSTFKFTSTSSKHEMLLSVRKELSSSWHVSLYSPYWLVNKTGLTLEYSTRDFWGGADNEMTHPPNQTLLLFPHKQAHVRVLQTVADQNSEWSDSFSLDTVGSEGVLTCQSKEQLYQMGIEVRLSKLNLSKIITITPFHMLQNLTRDSVSVLELGLALKDAVILKPGELVPFWPQSDTELIKIGINGPSRSSTPIKYTINGSMLLKLPGEVPAVCVEVQVTGSANMVTFQPYYHGAAPVRLVNDCHFNIAFGQTSESSDGEDKGTIVHTLKPGTTQLYTWDYPLCARELFWQVIGGTKTRGTLKLKDSNGEFTIPKEYINVTTSPPLVKKGEKKDDKEGEEEPDGFVSDPELESDDEDKEEEVEEEEQGKEETDGNWKVGRFMKKRLKGVGKRVVGVRRTLRLWTKKKKTGDPSKGYWVSFTDNLQRVVLFTPFKEVAERALQGSEPARTLIDVSLSLRAVGLSLVNDERGQEVAYISLPQSDVIWEMAKSRKRWKPVELVVGNALEKMFQEKKRGIHDIQDTDWIVDFSDPDRLSLIQRDGERKMLRRSHFEGLYARVALSKSLTTVEFSISKLQIDNHLPFARNPIIFYCYPPPPAVASSVAPKPFVSGTIIVRNTSQANTREVQYLKVLVQEMGFTLDIGFLIGVANLFESVAEKLPKEQLMAQDDHYIHLSLKEAEAMEVSSATARTFFKMIHLSPIDIHISFSLAMSESEKQEAQLFADTNIILKSILDIIYSFVSFLGRAKDAELKLGYFEVQERSLTNAKLIKQIQKHYQQQALLQLYKVVFGLEVLGNPVGFLSGLTEGTIGLFYQPIQGAVAGPEEFMEGLALGTHQFVEGTVGGIAGVGARVTGALGDAVAKLTFDQEFQGQRRQGDTSIGRGIGGLGKGIYEGVTGIVFQPVKGARKEGVLGLLKGTGKGVLGLVLRPTGGLIDLTSATFAAVQKTTKVGDFELTQVRTARFIGLDQIIYPYSSILSAGYAVFMEVDDGKFYHNDVFIGQVELSEDPLRNLLVTDSCVMVLKYNGFFKKWEKEATYMFRDFYKSVYNKEGSIKLPIMESTGFLFGSKKKHEVEKDLEIGSDRLAKRAERIINRGYQQYKTEQSLLF